MQTRAAKCGGIHVSGSVEAVSGMLSCGDSRLRPALSGVERAVRRPGSVLLRTSASKSAACIYRAVTANHVSRPNKTNTVTSAYNEWNGWKWKYGFREKRFRLASIEPPRPTAFPLRRRDVYLPLLSHRIRTTQRFINRPVSVLFKAYGRFNVCGEWLRFPLQIDSLHR